ncbi:UDP-N-acetylglucosamine 2-epimerase [Patescibacteria group bacterium]
MKTLIISQDATIINTFTGVGRLYSLFINTLQKLRVAVILKITPFKTEVLVVADSKQISATHHQIVYWDQVLASLKLEKKRDLAWRITDKIISPLFKDLKYKNIPFIKLWQTYLTAHISFNILGYQQALEKLIKDFKPAKIIICGSSPQEQIAKLIASQNNLQVVSYNFLDFSKLNRWFIDWLYDRQQKIRLKKFLTSRSVEFKTPAKGSYLLIASFFRHLKTLVPLSLGLNKQNLKNIFIADDLMIQQSLSKLYQTSDNCLFLSNYLKPATISQILNHQKKLGRSVWKKISARLSLPPRNIEDISLNLLQGYLKTLFIRVFPLTCLYLEAGSHLINQVKPKGIFLVSDLRPLEVSLGLLAKVNKIPSLLVSPNTILSLDAVNQYSIADKIAVVGPHIKKQLVRIGVPIKKIHLVGDLRFDSINLKKINQYKKLVYQQLQLKPQTKLFLLISFRANPRIPLTEKRRFFEIASKAVNQISKTRLIIKPHPSETKQQVLDQLKQWGIKNALVVDNQKLELIELLNACHAVLLTWSMTGFESLIMKKPVVVINPTRKDYDEIIPYVKAGGAQLAKSASQLKHILKQLINNPAYYNQWVKNGQQFVKQYIKPPDHQVAQRISRLIKAPLADKS